LFISVLNNFISEYIVNSKYTLTESDVLYEDNHLIVINKQAGLLSQGDKTNDKNILDYVKAYIKNKYDKPGLVFLGLPHRLDRPVSGAIVLCKTSKSLTRMNKMISERKIDKIYHAIVLNKPKDNKGTITSFLRKNTHKNKVDCFDQEVNNSKKAILNFQYHKRIGNFHLLEVKLLTGRPHQIRVQLNSINCPILGDMKYHNQKPLSDKSIALHSRFVEFIHPVSKVKISIAAPYPDKPWWSN